MKRERMKDDVILTGRMSSWRRGLWLPTPEKAVTEHLVREREWRRRHLDSEERSTGDLLPYTWTKATWGRQ